MKYAILGLLSREDMTGYDIARRFNIGLGSFWSAKHSQIYPELKKLTGEGLVNFRTVIQGERLEKKLYTITGSGRKDFSRWMRLQEDLQPTPKDVFKLRTYYSEELGDEELRHHFEDQLHKRRHKRDHLREEMEKNYTGRPFHQLSGSDKGDYMVLEAAIMRESTYVDWLERCLERLMVQSR